MWSGVRCRRPSWRLVSCLRVAAAQVREPPWPQKPRCAPRPSPHSRRLGLRPRATAPVTRRRRGLRGFAGDAFAALLSVAPVPSVRLFWCGRRSRPRPLSALVLESGGAAPPSPSPSPSLPDASPLSRPPPPDLTRTCHYRLPTNYFLILFVSNT